jgi:hypothetical protein
MLPSPSGRLPTPERIAQGLLRLQRLLTQGMQRTAIRSFVIALLATSAVWGRGLSCSRTFTPDSQTWGLRPTCRAGGPRLDCMAPIEELRSLDAGSPAWVTTPTSYFLERARERGEPRPQWNPYDGSGYPLALDGHSARFSPTEWFLSHVRGDQGQDIVIFLRFLSWTFALVWAIALFEKSALLLLAMAFVVTLAPYGATYIHIAFLDVDLLGPWFLLLLLLLWRKRIRPPAALGAALFLGLLVGAFAFPQAQLVMVMSMAVVAAMAVSVVGSRSLFLFLALSLGAFLVVPAWAPMLANLDQFVSSRSVQCICTQSVGLRSFFYDLVNLPPKPSVPATITLAGLVLLPWVPRRLWFVSASVVLMILWLAMGLPTSACALPLISGLRFSRHLQPHLQMLFLFGTCVAINRLGRRLDRDRKPLLILLPIADVALFIASSAPAGVHGLAMWACILGATLATLIATTLPWAPRWKALRRDAFSLALILLVFPTYLTGSNISVFFLKGRSTTPELPPVPSVIDPETPLGKVQELSRDQDRRHFSPLGWVYPNWSQALEILDLRSLNALYPSGIHQLNGGLFSSWERDPKHVLKPDRFTATVPPYQYMRPDFQRVLALHRVSLLTFTKGQARFPKNPGPYQQSKCQLLGADAVQGTESYICPEVGGVGFFPEIVKVVGTRLDTLLALKRMSPADLTRTALLGPELDPALGPAGPTVAKGQVVSMARSANHLLYWLWVEKPGTFVVADAYFRGWTATVNGQPTAISRANIAFKAVQVPQGFVDLHFHFQVEGL